MHYTNGVLTHRLMISDHRSDSKMSPSHINIDDYMNIISGDVEIVKSQNHIEQLNCNT